MLRIALALPQKNSVAEHSEVYGYASRTVLETALDASLGWLDRDLRIPACSPCYEIRRERVCGHGDGRRRRRNDDDRDAVTLMTQTLGHEQARLLSVSIIAFISISG